MSQTNSSFGLTHKDVVALDEILVGLSSKKETSRPQRNSIIEIIQRRKKLISRVEGPYNETRQEYANELSTRILLERILERVFA